MPGFPPLGAANIEAKQQQRRRRAYRPDLQSRASDSATCVFRDLCKIRSAMSAGYYCQQVGLSFKKKLCRKKDIYNYLNQGKPNWNVDVGGWRQ